MEPRPPPTAPTQAPTTRQKVPGPQLPSLTGKGRGHQPPQPRGAPTEATVNLLDLNHPAVTYCKDATTALQELSMAQGPEWVPHLLAFQEQGLQRDDSRKPPPYIPRTRKRINATSTRGPPCTPEPASTSTPSTTSASQGG